MDFIQPVRLSEHLSWGSVKGVYMPDLLPLPYTCEALDVFCHNLDKAQNALQRPLLIENPSSYLEYKFSDMHEADFLVEVCRRTGASILLDINNIFVSSCNHGWDMDDYLSRIPSSLIQEIHIAGHSLKPLPQGGTLRVDTHNTPVCHEVWDLLGKVIQQTGPLPTLLEWDTDIPPLKDLLQEASKIASYFYPQVQECYA